MIRPANDILLPLFHFVNSLVQYTHAHMGNTCTCRCLTLEDTVMFQFSSP